MSKLSITFKVAVPYSTVQAVFSTAINHWVENCQNKTSAFAKALIIGTAVDQFQHGSAFVGALAFTAAKGQGAQHPNITSSKVSIPASASTYGGEMIVTAIPSSDGNTTIEINGHTQGLWGATLKENVNGLRGYLEQSLPALDQQYKQIQLSDSHEQTRPSIGVAEEIERLSSLHKTGALSDTEYAQAKQKVLSQ
jgi:hypothetical protein